MINNSESVFLRNFVAVDESDSFGHDSFALKVNLNILKSDVHTLFTMLLQLINKLEEEKVELQNKASVLEANLASSEYNIALLQTKAFLSQHSIISLETRLEAVEKAFDMLTKA